MSAKQTIVGLATYNSWRRGDETIEMPAPAEIGATIDHAVNLLRKYDEMERKLTAEREKVRVLRAEVQTQCLLNAKGSEREASLLGRLARAEREIVMLRAESQQLKTMAFHMKIPIGFEVRDVTEEEIRAAQTRLLKREETDADRSLLDAVLSWFALFLANVQRSATPARGRWL